MTSKAPAIHPENVLGRVPGTLKIASIASWVFGLSLFSLGLPLDGQLGRFSQRAAGVVADSGSGLTTVILWVALYGLAGMLVLSAWRTAFVTLKHSIWFAGLVAYLGISLIWSRNNALGLEQFLGLAGSSCIGLMAAIRYRKSPELLVLHASTALGLAQIANLLLVLLFPSLGIEPLRGRWAGLYGAANYLGSLAMFSILLSALAISITAGRQKGFYALVLIASALNLIGTESATSIFSVFAGLIVLLSWDTISAKTATGLLARFALFIVALAYILLNYFGYMDDIVSSILQIFGKRSDFSGRGKIWAEAEPYINAQPILGYGIGSRFAISSIFGITDLHSGYLSLLYQGGSIAILLLGLSIYSNALQGLRLIKHNRFIGKLGFSIVAAVLTYNFTESSILSARSPGFMLLSVIIFIYAAAIVSRKVDA